MELRIEQNCPSCGAPITLHEADRLIACPFCDVHNYRLGHSPGRYILPATLPGHIDENSLFYIPYIRFKGSIFYVKDAKVQYKIIDTTRIGVETDFLPLSLGLRPQAMKVRPVVAATGGAFVRQTVETREVFSHAVAIVDLFSRESEKGVLHRAFIGETISRIYQPCYVHENVVYDAVDNRELCHRSNIEHIFNKTITSRVSWEPQFVSTLCPHCGDILSGERDSLVLDCQNCHTLWREGRPGFVQVRWEAVAGDKNSADIAMPFWKITFSTTGKVLESYGDYLRFTNQPVIVKSEFDDIKLVFRIPAFKMNPKSFLQIASRLTVSQLRIPEGQKGHLKNLHPVNLASTEAIQAIKSVLAATTLNKKIIRLFLSKLVVVDPECTLEYLPFSKQSHDLIQQHTGTTIRAAAVRFGRTL